jgi:dephospho-CoA kinase
VETGSWRRYDRLIVVSCAPEVQLARVMARDGLTRAEAEARIRAQMAMAERERVASVVVRNDGDPDALRARVATGWQRWVGTPPT